MRQRPISCYRQSRISTTTTSTVANATLTAARRYGIDRYPAIVFDARAVIYGETDLRQALRRYARWGSP